MNVVRLPAKRRTLSILDGAPNRSSSLSFMGLVETVAWIAFRDERPSLAARWHSLDRPDLDSNWIGAAWLMLAEDVGGGPLKAIEDELIDRCAAGKIVAKGQGRSGFQDIPEHDWFGARIVAKEPDCILCAGWTGQGWTHVQFRREDVLALWPPASGAVAVIEKPSQSQTNKRPPWYPLLRSMIEAEHKRLKEWFERKPGIEPPRFPTAVKFRNTLIAKGFPEKEVRPSTVRYHVRNIRAESDC